MRKLTKSEYTPAEVRRELAALLQEKIDSYGTQLRKLREREVGRTALAKGDLCLICARLPKECPCLRLRKASAEEANREMKGFKSVASNPTFGGGTVTNAPKTAPRSGNGNRAASGVIPNAKAECGMGKKFKIPGKKGGKLKKHTAATPSPDARPAPSGIPGKQPVGQGGGDAFKVPHAATSASLNDVRQLAPAAANATKDKAGLPGAKAPAAAPAQAPGAAMPKTGVHPDTKASLGNVQAMAPNAAWKGAGLPSLKAKLQNVQASHALAPKAPAAAPARPTAIVARPAAAPAPAARQQLSADKRAGGVGFLNNLLSRFRRPPAGAAPTPGIAAAPAAPRVASARFHGALPLQRSEPSTKAAKKSPFPDAATCFNCKKSEHSGICKEEMPAPTEGLSGVNHNRNMLSVGSTKIRRGNSKRNRR